MTFEATKDPDSVEDFAIDWTATLNESTPADTIATSVWTADAGVTVDSNSEAGGVTRVWVSGGVRGAPCNLVNRITTAAGRTYDRTIAVTLEDL
mgnify:CR=1 FL=1